MSETVTLKKEDLEFIQEQFRLYSAKLTDLTEELEMYKAECEPVELSDILDLTEIEKHLKVAIIEDEELEYNANDSDFENN